MAFSNGLSYFNKRRINDPKQIRAAFGWVHLCVYVEISRTCFFFVHFDKILLFCFYYDR